MFQGLHFLLFFRHITTAQHTNKSPSSTDAPQAAAAKKIVDVKKADVKKGGLSDGSGGVGASVVRGNEVVVGSTVGSGVRISE